jgi:hypothetical protein
MAIQMSYTSGIDQVRSCCGDFATYTVRKLTWTRY